LRKGIPLNPKNKKSGKRQKMAIYHFSIKNIGRSNGRSAVAAAAYRSGEKLVDSVYGKEQDYTQKTGIEYKNIYVPSHANENLLDRQTLWNEVEKSELKKNGDLKTTARLAKEFEIAFPHEADADTRKRMLDELAQTLVKNHNVVVDAVIHAPHTKSGSDERNYHAHVMFTTRSINEHGELGKKAREFNDDGRNLTLAYRELWANMVNRELEQIGTQERVSHLSYSDLKYDLEPTVHEGSMITQLRRQGIDTEISLKNDLIKQQNAEKQRLSEILEGLEQEIIATEKIIAKLRTESPNNHEKTKDDANVYDGDKNRLERKPEQSSTILQDIPTSEKQIAVQLFKTKIQDLAQKIHEKELKTIINQMNEYMETSKKLLDQIETHRNNKPFNPFKLKAWEGELANLVHQHDNEIKAKYDHLKTEHQKIKNRGVAYEHWQKAESLIQEKYPDEYKKIKDLERQLDEQNATISKTRTQEQDTDKERGR
jgi:hypothetical protein